MRKKRSAVTAVLFILTLLSAAAILFFSSQTAEESSARSRGVTAWLVRMLCGGFDSLSGEERDVLIARLFPPIRIRMKTARQGNLGRRRRECKPLQMGEFPSATGG